MTNGQPLIVRAAKKPIATLQKPLESIDMESKQPHTASYERSDVCAVSACSTIIENVVAFEVAAAMIDKFGGDSLEEMKQRWNCSRNRPQLIRLEPENGRLRLPQNQINFSPGSIKA